MQVSALSTAASNDATNEDWVSASAGVIVVLDGATVRTDTGCSHGVGWYVMRLGSALAALATDRQVPLPVALRAGIEQVAALHPNCDLSHPGTPSAAVAMMRTSAETLEYLGLGDVTILLDTETSTRAITDDRVDSTAVPERKNADRYPIGSPEKYAALLLMKHAELAARNRQGGYWVAAADPTVASQALTGAAEIAELRQVALLTDGAARIVTLFKALTWSGLLEVLNSDGLDELVRRIRSLEDGDPLGSQWPRNKRSDDATLVYARPVETSTALTLDL